MDFKRRKSERVRIFSEEKVRDKKIPGELKEEKKVYCIIKDISVDGVCLLISKEQDIPQESFILNINPIKEIGFVGMTIKTKKVWEDSNETILHKSIGSEFIKDSEEIEENIKEFYKQLKKSDVPHLFILATVEY